eukprot:scaffold6130_cov33-Prasinocladus_malaysianus.AAC.3
MSLSSFLTASAVSFGFTPNATRGRMRMGHSGDAVTAWRRTTSVQIPGPVRSRVSRLVLLLKRARACAATKSQTSRSTGWPGAAIKTH